MTAFAHSFLADAAAMAFRGTFEAHLTVVADRPDRLAAFEAVCETLGVRCVRIELARGVTRSQPMTASYHRGTLAEAVHEIEALHAALLAADFSVVRVKVEAVVPAEGLDGIEPFATAGYFEFHAKLRLPHGTALEPIEATCIAHAAHLSKNDRKAEAVTFDRFVTLRVPRVPFAEAAARFSALVAALEAGGHTVVGQKRELTVYDGKLELDAGWL